MRKTVPISILVPVFNREDLLPSCIESALRQTIDELEVVVVDNASTDGTWGVCQDFARSDCRVRVFRNETNLGPVRNWQRCIDEARGRFGKILFSDDLMMPAFLARTLPLLQDARVAFAFTVAEIGPEPGNGQPAFVWKGRQYIPSARFRREALKGHRDLPVSPSAALFRMEDLRKNLVVEIPCPSCRDYARHGAGPDELLYLLTAARYPLVAHVDEPLVVLRGHAGSITSSSPPPYLNNHRHGARIWFASAYEGPAVLREVAAYAWAVTCFVERRWISPQTFLQRFSERSIPLGPWACGKALLRRLRERLLG